MLFASCALKNFQHEVNQGPICDFEPNPAKTSTDQFSVQLTWKYIDQDAWLMFWEGTLGWHNKNYYCVKTWQLQSLLLENNLYCHFFWKVSTAEPSKSWKLRFTFEAKL